MPAGPAPDPGVHIDWHAPADCPTASDLETLAERYATDEGASVRADARVERMGAGYVLRLSIAGDDGIREIRADSCQAVAEAAVLLATVAAETAMVREVDDAPLAAVVPEPIEAAATVTSSLDVTENLEPRRPRAPETTPPPQVAPQTPRPPPRITAVLRADAGVQLFRLLPGTSAAFGSGLGIRGQRWRVEARGRYVLPRGVDYARPIRGGADISVWTAGAAGCFEPRWGRFAAPLCAGVAAGAMRARGRGVTRPSRASYPFAEATASAAATVAVSARIAITAGVEGTVSVIRPRFHIEDRPMLFRAGPGATRVLVGAEVRLR